ncbi:MAG: glycosyltransferase family 2 protein [Holosporaceae bacterium]|jgi:glycosyltransferase involved in cell wall biosynthesis|nr:glycosyltransferase family 2 protein [Holosporaceae bacterium]
MTENNVNNISQNDDAHRASIIDVSLVVPFYNEAESVEVFFNKLGAVIEKIDCSLEVLCINDGSSDDTLTRLIKKKKTIRSIKIIDFSRNFGKDAALTAGLDFAKGNCVIPMDCDLQDPPELLVEMINKWRDGYDVVLAQRSDRSQDVFLKRITARLFYKIHNFLSDVELPENVGDFRLLDRKVVNVIRACPERKRFMKGLFAFAGFKTIAIKYKRPPRKKGESKWDYWKLWNYAIDGITSFSTFPLKIWTYLGILVTLLAFARGFWIFFRVIFCGIDVPGYASLMAAILFLSGTQMISLGLIGEYVGRIYMESKQRPIYVVSDIIE